MLAQFAAGPYLVFFAVLVFSPIAVFRWLYSRNNAAKSTSQPSRTAVEAAAVRGILGLLNVWIYADTVPQGPTRQMQEIINLAPTWAAWFSTSPVHTWWPTGWPGGSEEHNEHVLWSGFMPMLLSTLVLLVFWRNRNQLLARSGLVFIATAWTLVLVIVRWPSDFSLWIMLSDQVEPLRAFRAIGRIHILTHAFLCFSIGAAATLLLPRVQQIWRYSGVAMIGCLIVEAIGSQTAELFHPTCTGTAKRRAGRLGGGGRRMCSPLPLASTNQPATHIHLDAWAAALASQRRTLNGYSGNAPLDYLHFLWTPGSEQTRALINEQGLRAENISVVSRFPSAAAAKLGIECQNAPDLPFLTGFDLQPVSAQLFSPVEIHRFDGRTFYQFTPPCSLAFSIPAGTRAIQYAPRGIRRCQ